MTKLFSVQCIHPYFTNLPTDVMVNNFHFQGQDAQTPEDVGLLIQASITAFFSTIYVGGATKANYIDWAQATMKVFDLSDPTPRVPWIGSIATTAGTLGVTVPTEVACVATWHAAPESGVRFQRLYNRIYLGGITQNHITASAADQFPRFTPTFTALVCTAMENLEAANPWDPGDVSWVQVSNAGGVTAARAITGGWVDNGPDTQRRRSVLATLKSTWSV